MTKSWKTVTGLSNIEESTRVQLLHGDYLLDKRRKSRLTLYALTLNVIAIASSLGLVLLFIASITQDVALASRPVWLGLCFGVIMALSIGLERRLRTESEAISASLLRAERRLWKAGISDFTSEHVARHQQPLISTSSTISLKERRSPSGADLVGTERLMQTFLDLIVAPFGSVTQVRTEADSLGHERSRIARALGAAEGSFGEAPLCVGVLCASSFDPLNSDANVSLLSHARLWQEADQSRLLVCGPTFRPETFDPWDPDSRNRITVYLPQLGREAIPRMLSSQVALLFSEREDLAEVSVFCHQGDSDELQQSFSRRGLAAKTAFRYEATASDGRISLKMLTKKGFYFLNGPRLESPLTFDVGLTLDSDICDVMAEFFEASSEAVVAALSRVDEVRAIEKYVYVPESHRIEISLSSWRSSQDNRQDLLWNLFRSFAAFYRPDGDWKRAGSPSISLLIDSTPASRSGQFMEYLALARQTRELIRV